MIVILPIDNFVAKACQKQGVYKKIMKRTHYTYQTRNSNMYSARNLSCYACALLMGLLLLFSVNNSVFAQDGGQDDGATAAADPAVLEHGKKLFNQKCKSCHAVTAEVVVGPGLKGILDRRDEAWLIKWIRNSQAVIASGDEYAVKIYEQYNKTQMQSFPELSDDDIRAILAYSVDAGNAVVATTTPGENNDKTASGSGDSALAGYVPIILGVLAFVLVLILAVLFLLITILTRYLKQQEQSGKLDESDQEVLNQKFNILAVFQSKIFIGGVAVVFVLVVAKAVLDGLIGIGIQQGYAPTQPIAFSHKLHAGELEIDCEYCHTGVRKGKSATIPAANTCMNCHNAIKRESPEIKKIYAAIENDKPIEWVRIHNLPDFAYFNHAQHVEVGGLECQNCHGEIEQMEVVQQRSTLTMGWCIDCHRETVVKAEGNAYYDRLLETHKANSKKPMRVEDIGGLECAKCHY
jgi:mono/diheme cytochrome c family protein